MARPLLTASPGPFVESPISADEKLIRDTTKSGNLEERQPFRPRSPGTAALDVRAYFV